MNKEEIIKLLKKKQDRFYRQKSKGIAFNDDDYEANYILLYIENLQSQLDIANKKLDEIEEYITSYESISTIQGLENIKMNKYLDDKTMVEMTNRYFKVHDKILSIIGGE